MNYKKFLVVASVLTFVSGAAGIAFAQQDANKVSEKTMNECVALAKNAIKDPKKQKAFTDYCTPLGVTGDAYFEVLKRANAQLLAENASKPERQTSSVGVINQTTPNVDTTRATDSQSGYTKS